ncbi:hypothetical protein [Streptomyces canus]|uniref:hypothetical protein n=1 Tax=Streptomyces canus TaxID=58343 RepID=UPI0038095654
MGLIDVEVSRHDWSALRYGCGKTKEHLADDLLRRSPDWRVTCPSGRGFDAWTCSFGWSMTAALVELAGQ